MAIDHVAEPCPRWKAMSADLDMIHDLMGGTRQMRQAGLRWLPKEYSETWEAWRARLNRSVLFNGLARTIAALSGRPFGQDVRVINAHPVISDFIRNMDGKGCSLTTLAGQILRLMLRDGLVYVLVDTKPDGSHPYCVLVEASQMIGLRHDPESAHISQARIRERILTKTGQFSDAWTDQIRVLEPGQWSLFRQDERRHSTWRQHQSGLMDIAQVPIVECAVNADATMISQPPLMDLAWLNIAHWQSSSDQRHILHIARVPILFAKGMDASDSQIEIGPNRIIIAEDNSADIKFVEHSGAAIAAGHQDLLDLEEKMAVMGLDLIARRPGQPTATEKAIDHAQSNAFLHMLVDDLRDHLNAVLRQAALWFGLPEAAAGEVILPKYFPINQQQSDQAHDLLDRHKQGMSPDDFLSAVERKGIFSSINTSQ